MHSQYAPAGRYSYPHVSRTRRTRSAWCTSPAPARAFYARGSRCRRRTRPRRSKRAAENGRAESAPLTENVTKERHGDRRCQAPRAPALRDCGSSRDDFSSRLLQVERRSRDQGKIRLPISIPTPEGLYKPFEFVARFGRSSRPASDQRQSNRSPKGMNQRKGDRVLPDNRTDGFPALAHTVVVGLQSLFGSAANLRGKRRGARERGTDGWMGATAVHARTQSVGVMLAWRARKTEPQLGAYLSPRGLGHRQGAVSGSLQETYSTHLGLSLADMGARRQLEVDFKARRLEGGAAWE
ncbi:hypothetical protein B0H14DRAFT_2560638 [Mycena olivaceomarginata]|nr:hypothetical protein B0H14DRAFT_2560638 [Mycena olivaceomarginata]